MDSCNMFIIIHFMSISSHLFGTKTVTFQEDKYSPVHILKMNQPSYGLK